MTDALAPIEGDELWEEIAERAATVEGSLHSIVSPYHFWRADWGSDLRRRWDAEGSLHVTRAYRPADDPDTPSLVVCEIPYGPSLCMGTGGVVWPASLALASYLVRQRSALRLSAARSVLEIGAGSGIPGLSVALLASDPGCRVVLTDENQCILANLRRNVEANLEALAAQVEVAPFAWEAFLQGAAPAPVEGSDLLLGSDVIWGERGPAVARLALRLVRPGGMLILTAEEGRDGLDAFEDILRGGECECEGEAEFSVEVLKLESLGKRCLLYACRRRGAT